MAPRPSLTANVSVRNPDTGQVVTLLEGTRLPEWAVPLTQPTSVGNPPREIPAVIGAHVLDGEVGGASASSASDESGGADDGGSGDELEAPPRSGTGSGKKAWAKFAAASNVEVPADANRDEIIAALEAAGVVAPE